MDFGNFFEFLDYVKKLKLIPIFEVMSRSNALQKFRNYVNPEEYWENLVFQIVSKLIVRYGINEISLWKFETWNEPDLTSYNVLNFTTEEYLHYVEGCARGLKSAFEFYTIMNTSSSVVADTVSLGGPAGLFRNRDHHPLCWGLLESCNRNVNVKKKGTVECPIQFISFHRKGDSNVDNILNGTLQLLDLFDRNFPNLKNFSIYNDEADILKNWSRDEDWRGDVRYAAMLSSVVVKIFTEIIKKRGRKIEISNDNAFLNYHPYYFTQRTLLARFQMNLTNPPHEQFFRKPVYSVFGLLSFLGDKLLETSQNDHILTLSTTLSFPKFHNSISVLLISCNDTNQNSYDIQKVHVFLKNLRFKGKFVVYTLDNFKTNPYKVWKRGGEPVFPQKSLREAMRRNEGPERVLGPSSFKTQKTLKVTLNTTIPSVFLLHLCSKPHKAPAIVTNLEVKNITWNEVLLTWSDETFSENRCIRTYEVEFESRCGNKRSVAAVASDTKGGTFRRVNRNDIIFLWYHHVATGDAVCEATRGKYRIRAVDYWDRPGQYSKTVSYPPLASVNL